MIAYDASTHDDDLLICFFFLHLFTHNNLEQINAELGLHNAISDIKMGGEDWTFPR